MHTRQQRDDFSLAEAETETDDTTPNGRDDDKKRGLWLERLTSHSVNSGRRSEEVYRD